MNIETAQKVWLGKRLVGKPGTQSEGEEGYVTEVQDFGGSNQRITFDNISFRATDWSVEEVQKEYTIYNA